MANFSKEVNTIYTYGNSMSEFLFLHSWTNLILTRLFIFCQFGKNESN